MAQQPRVALRQTGEVSVIEIAGDVTAFAGGPIKAAYQAAAQQGKKVLLSFRAGDHINSAGIAILIDLVAESRNRGQGLRIAHPDAHFHKIFELVGLTGYVEVFASEAEGLAGF
jgi:anti-anti-sigma factor